MMSRSETSNGTDDVDVGTYDDDDDEKVRNAMVLMTVM